MRIRVLAGVFAGATLLAGCGGDVPAEPNALPPQNLPAHIAPEPPPPAAGDSVELDASPTLAAIQQRRQLLVGVRADQERFVTRDESGEYRGFDVEVARDLAKRIGLDPGQVQFRRLPPTLLLDAVSAGNVDILLGGTAKNPQLAEVGPYAVTDTPRYIVIKSGDKKLAEQLQQMLDAAVADGTWQRAYDTTLAPAGVSARPR